MQKIQEKTQRVRQNSLDLINQKNVELKFFEKEFLEYELKYKATESIEKMRKKLSVLMVEYIWAIIINYEKILKKECQVKDKLIESNNNYENKIIQNQNELIKSNKEYKRLENYISQFTLNYEETINQFNESVKSFRSLKEIYNSTDKKVNKLNNSKEKRLKNIEDIEKKLDEQRNLCENDYIVEKKQKEETISKISEQLNEKLKIESSQIKKIESFTKSIELSQKEADNKKADLKSSERIIESLKNDINDLNKSTNDQIYRYGHQMANLVKEVDVFFNNSSFRHKPRGPIGMFIKPRDDKYSLAIEHCLGGLLTSFICANHQDEKILQELARKHYKNRKPPSIIVTGFNDPRYDSQRFKQQVADHTNYPTVYDMLDIQDNVIANTLMDQRMIESIYLLPNYETARKLVEFGTGRQKIQEAYIPTGDQYINKQSYKTYASHYNSPKYFIEDTSNLINSKHQKINDLANNIPVLTQAISILNKEIVENKRSKDNEDKYVHSIRKEINSLRNQLDDAKNIYIQEPVNLSIYEEELNKFKNEINKIDEEIKNIEADSSTKSQDFQKAKQNMMEWQSKKEKLESEHQECISKVTQIESDLEKNQEELNHYKELKDNNQIKINKLMPTISEYEKEIEILIQQAFPHDRVATNKNHEKLGIEIKLLEKEIKKNDKTNKNQKEIGDIYNEKKLKFNQIKNEIKMQNKFLEKLAESVRKREERIDMFIKSKSHRCVMSFTQYINSRGYSGYLQFDHIEQKLKINVSPSDNISNFDKNNDSRSLSGGERSFSTVSFLLSLWSIVESPILFLDEFDVSDEYNFK
jgi:structural maintenance of chromosomes protein 6